MNLSGQSVQGLARFYKLPIEHVLVAHDDLDLPFCTIRMRPGGGAGGQKGIKSIIDQLGTPEFARLRLGIDRPPADGRRRLRLTGFYSERTAGRL